MVISNLITPRKEIITSDYQFDLDIAKINYIDRLESKPEKFLAKTYPAKYLNKVIQIINNKIIGSSDLGAVVLSGNKGLGKTHTLLTAYNLFANPDATKNWLVEHEIKFNKFNFAIIKNKSKYCTVAARNLATDKLWEPIFRSLGAEELLKRVDDYPRSRVIKKLVNKEYTAIFIDELNDWFSQLKKTNSNLIEPNKKFLEILLNDATKNSNLFVFASIQGQNKELLETIKFSKSELLNLKDFAAESKLINYRLFNSINKSIQKNEINTILEKYLNTYHQQEFNLLGQENLKQNLLATYPFHSDLIKLLDEQLLTTKLNLLASALKKNYQEKDLLLVSDIALNDLSTLNSEIYTSAQKINNKLGKSNFDFFTEVLTTLTA